MDWPTWQQGTISAIVCGLLALAFRQRSWVRTTASFIELALISTLYAIWRLARELPLASDQGAVQRAQRLNDLERWLHMPSELSLQHFAIDHAWLGRFLNYYYAIVHVPATLTFLVWLFWRYRDKYPHWRNGMAFCTAGCLFIRFYRVAPPRLVPSLGYIDLASIFGLSVYGPYGTGVSDQLAAMPSVHVGWAAVVSLGIVACSTSKWRWLWLSHLILTVLAVSATGNHWWLDGVVAVALLLIGLRLDGWVRAWARARVRPGSPVVEGDVVLSGA